MTAVRYFTTGGLERHELAGLDAGTQTAQIVVVFVLIVVVTAGMLAWTKRLGWW